MTTHMDDGIRRIHEALERNGFLENTNVIHSSDHGKQEGNHGMVGKQNMYEEAVTVPMIMAGPDIPRGEQRDQLVFQHDLFPTILNWAGADIPEGTYYEDLRPCLESGSHQGRETLCSSYKAAQRMIRDQRYKFIAYEVDGQRREELFDLENDPSECNDLSKKSAQQDRVLQMRKELKNWQQQVGDPCEVL